MVDEALAKFGIQDNKLYELEFLYNVLIEIGITRMKKSSFITDWFKRKVTKGEIVMPEKKKNYRWKLTGKQIREITVAYLPGGKGEYNAC